MFKSLLGGLVGKIYSTSKTHEEEVERVSGGDYQTNAGNPWEPLYPVVEQRTLHQWEWASDAPEKGLGLADRHSGVVATCAQCKATSIMSHVAPHIRYLLNWGPLYIPQPFCPATCQETMDLMRISPLTAPERRASADMWNHTFKAVDAQIATVQRTQIKKEFLQNN